uniref:Uncharacterized protein n=1 Tax=Timema cristinae TaxID=61476 RepID=A0A7R9GTR6_TIMCR|nr:unnamed protein product [Timema cristinae]
MSRKREEIECEKERFYKEKKATHKTRKEVKEGFGNQINLCRDRLKNSGPTAQKSDTLPADKKKIANQTQHRRHVKGNVLSPFESRVCEGCISTFCDYSDGSTLVHIIANASIKDETPKVCYELRKSRYTTSLIRLTTTGLCCTDVRRSALHKEKERERCMRRFNQNNTMRRELARGNPPSHKPSRTKDRAALQVSEREQK